MRECVRFKAYGFLEEFKGTRGIFLFLVCSGWFYFLLLRGLVLRLSKKVHFLYKERTTVVSNNVSSQNIFQ